MHFFKLAGKMTKKRKKYTGKKKFFKLAGKMTKKKNIKKKYWSRLDSNHCASGYWITRKVSKDAKIRNRYNQVPHMTQDTNGKVINL